MWRRVRDPRLIEGSGARVDELREGGYRSAMHRQETRAVSAPKWARTGCRLTGPRLFSTPIDPRATEGMHEASSEATEAVAASSTSVDASLSANTYPRPLQKARTGAPAAGLVPSDSAALERRLRAGDRLISDLAAALWVWDRPLTVERTHNGAAHTLSPSSGPHEQKFDVGHALLQSIAVASPGSQLLCVEASSRRALRHEAIL